VQVRSDAGDERSREEHRNIGMSEHRNESVRTSHRKTREGRVVSDKMDKTVVVAVEDRVKHSLYGKVIRRTNKLKAHDATNAVTIGDRVLIMETRPLSATKRWRVVEVLEKAK
jgi:small subunit ribosomal protein S17